MKRTFFRIMIDSLFVNNPIFKAIATFINLCNNSVVSNCDNLKFSKNIPLNKKEAESSIDRRFVFAKTGNLGVNIK